MTKKTALKISLFLLCPLLALAVWLSALSFVPVPWPDDSAFYFVAKSLFAWPPRWVMLPQAPFEPTYRIFNFNTMPLYPILLGLGRFIGIDGSHAIKLWPLLFWGLSGSALAVGLFSAGLPWLLCALVAFAVGLDPELRWASVLVRPESLIGLFGVIVVLGVTFGWWRKGRFKETDFWDPIAALLALAAYSHFNAVHLVFPVIAAFILDWKRLVNIGWKTALYLMPWMLTVAYRWNLFQLQMLTQWRRLAVPNGWLDSIDSAISSLFQALGSPEPWPDSVKFASVVLWMMIGIAVLVSLWEIWELRLKKRPFLLPSATWVFSAIWLWHTKPEVWFVYYIHIAVLTFAGLTLLRLWQLNETQKSGLAQGCLAGWTILISAVVGVTGFVDVSQAARLGSSVSWHWDTYQNFVDCIDTRLSKLEKDLGSPKPFRVWDPTFPDVTVELSRRHPDWDLTRTNDFAERWPLGIQHGHVVEAVVVPETLNWQERNVSAPLNQIGAQSVWMNWKGYFLNQLNTEPGWKPNRYYCQRGRWQAFIYMN
jgi:hypothetical protein